MLVWGLTTEDKQSIFECRTAISIVPLSARRCRLQNDYVMLADIWPTGYHATEMACLQPGESVVTWRWPGDCLPRTPRFLKAQAKFSR